MKKIIYILFISAIVAACTQKGQQKGSEETDTLSTDTAITQDYDSLVASEARAAIDSTYAQSDEYKSAHEAYDKVLDKETDGMDEAQSALYELEIAVKSLNKNGSYFASNTELMRDPVNQQRMRITAEKAHELGLKVKAMTLTPEQQQLFDSLKTIIHLQ